MAAGDRITCIWWEMTDKMTPFDKSGISSPILRRIGTELECSINELPAGALYADKLPDGYEQSTGAARGTDGRRVYCVTPGDHHWCIDGRASNCDKPGDETHRCWIRHGTVGEAITVDKNGNTCGAGGGSIAVPGYHGMLTNGELIEC